LAPTIVAGVMGFENALTAICKPEQILHQ